MKTRQSTSAAWIVGGYLLLTVAVASPLIREGYIGHGNGVVFLLATALTSPLNLLLLLLNDFAFDVNAFCMTGWSYLLTLGELGVGALLNAGLTYLVITFIERKWQKA
jgi:hypothetical protein